MNITWQTLLNLYLIIGAVLFILPIISSQEEEIAFRRYVQETMGEALKSNPTQAYFSAVLYICYLVIMWLPLLVCPNLVLPPDEDEDE